MKDKSTGFKVMAIIGLIVFIIGMCLLFPWLTLLAWNLLASSAGWYLVPVTWGTVCGLALVIVCIRLMFCRSKN
ncbi:hypothetical protein [Trabulsiella odontotermitis]|uniref:hypothetical protein n=1 Tax=Trabulsiella odontotermitis TaxID=379893 RepID=UPI0006768872|nr:hypothetical protein [Trabulsiella odontotermitis]